MAREMLDYDPLTGIFRWKIDRVHNAKAGDIAGYKDSLGYMRLSIFGMKYLCHRLAWLITTGSWPTKNIDHVDGDRRNNRFSNLRDVSQMTNIQNQRVSRRNGKLLGVSKNRKRWAATIMACGKKTYLGTFDTQELAHEAYVEAKRRLHEGCTI
jgi:hypothetical protein